MFDSLNTIMENNSEVMPAGLNTLSGFLVVTTNLVMAIGFALGLVSMAWSGYLYVMSKGEPKATTQAFHALIYGICAAGLSFIVGAIRLIVVQGLGVTDPDISSGDGLPDF